MIEPYFFYFIYCPISSGHTKDFTLSKKVSAAPLVIQSKIASNTILNRIDTRFVKSAAKLKKKYKEICGLLENKCDQKMMCVVICYMTHNSKCKLFSGHTWVNMKK